MLLPPDLKVISGSLYLNAKLAANLRKCIARKNMQPRKKKYYRQALLAVCRRIQALDPAQTHLTPFIADLERTIR